MKFLKFLADFIFPPKCMFCGNVMPHGSGGYMCRLCGEKIVFCTQSLCCRICGKPQISMGKKKICYMCQSKTFRSYKRSVACVKYDGLTASAIRLFKNGYRMGFGKIMAEEMAEQVREEYEISKIDFITNVASNSKNNRKRGFEPVTEICRELSEILKIPYEKNLLIKIRETPRQSSLDYSRRIRNLIGAVALARETEADGKTVLLVDDVMTTGSTIEENSYVLKQGGAKAVFAVTYGTTVKEVKKFVND